MTVMVKYCVYLDESGDFENDALQGKKRSGSLVGGFFWKTEEMPGTAGLSGKIEQIKKGEDHATELDSETKGTLAFELLTEVRSYPISFVIFQNDRKQKIINSTLTYLAVLTEGLVQLLKRLVILEKAPVELSVIAGFKKDATVPVTNSAVSGYIPLSDYQERLREKIALEKAKLQSDIFKLSVITIDLKDDKKNSLLILSDYVCNFWFTRRSEAFKRHVSWKGKDVSIKAALCSLFRDEYLFSMFTEEEDEHVFRMVGDGFYADALFEMCAGQLAEKNCELIRKSFLKLRPKQIHRQLDNFSDYLGDLIMFGGSEETSEKLLDRAEEFSAFLEENGIKEPKFCMDICLYRLALLDHRGKTDEMVPIFREMEPKVSEYTIRTLDAKYLLIFYTRYAVYLTDLMRYRECVNACENMELFLQMMEEAVRGNDFLELKGEIRSEQLGKVLGTKLQAQIFLSYLGEETYENARDTSERAIRQFSFPYDLKRQYQYRAELEAACGHAKEALYWVERSFDGKSWKEYISGPERSIFDIYTLLFIAAFIKKYDAETGVKIAGHIYQNCLSEIRRAGAAGSVCELFMGWAMIGDRALDKRGKSILRELAGQQGPSFVPEERILEAEKAALAGGDCLKVIFENREEK